MQLGKKEELPVSKDFGLRIFVGALLVLALAIFLHFRETRVEVLEFNAVAPRFILSQIDFEFPDEEASLILKEDALSEVGSIYRISEREIQEAKASFEKSLLQNNNWKEDVPTATLEELFRAVDSLEGMFLHSRFTDIHTLQKIQEIQIPYSQYIAYTPPSLDDPLFLPPLIWSNFFDSPFQEGFSLSSLQYVIDFFKSRKWTFEEDLQSKSLLRHRIEHMVPEKITRVKAGTRIIDQGEKVGARHIAMMKAMRESLDAHRSLWDPLPIISSLLFSFIFVLVSALYFQINHPEILRSLQKLSLLATIVVLTLIFAKGTEYILLHSSQSLLESIRYPLIIPFASILLCILLNGRIALYTSTFLAIILSVSLAVDHARFLIINIIASFAVIISMRSLRRRKQVFYVCGKAFLSSVLVLFAFQFASNTFWNLSLVDDLVCCFTFLFINAILVVGLLPLLESIFRVVTEMTLMEYLDPNHELMRRMTLEIPGTYQHSLVLGNLAERMAVSINADGLFCRAATLYHDIGKLINPQFFTENQQGGVSVHQLLTPLESAQVIIGHIKEGVELARKYRLPDPFIDIIREHHGTTLVYYFYCKEVERLGNEPSRVDQKQFRYPGPKPRSKESAIIMIADTLEAASRSLENITEKNITDMVERLIRDRIDDGQFDECTLTFEELSTIKKTLIKALLLTHHTRIKYPEKKPLKESIVIKKEE